MEQVCIDSCVFFHCLEYCDIFDKHGEAELIEKLLTDGKKLQDLNVKLKEVIGIDFLAKHSNTDIYNIFPLYKSYINSTKSNLETAIKNTQNLLLGEVKDKDGNVKKINIPNDRKQKLLGKLQQSIETLKNIEKNISKFQTLTDDYRNLRQKYYTGKLFEKMIRGQLQFFVVQDSYNEIQNHCKKGNNTDSQCFKYFDSTLIDKMLKHCTVVVFESYDQANLIDTLSKLYRTSVDGKPCMDSDINSLGVYGDSRIMAQSSILGINFVTLNEKDFITSKAGKWGNSDICNHIVNVNQNCNKIKNKVKPISPKEYLNVLENNLTDTKNL